MAPHFLFIDVIIQPHETVFVLCADGEAECLFAEKTYHINHWDGLLVSAVTKQEVFRITAHSPCHIGIVVVKTSLNWFLTAHIHSLFETLMKGRI